jgi:RND family efflux transporter MFP subunit
MKTLLRITRNRAPLTATLFALSALALALACSEPAGARKGGEKPTAVAAARAVTVARVGPQKLAKSLTVSGTLAAEEQVTVSVKVAGRLASIAVDLGTVVERGQAVAQVEPTDYQLRVEQAGSALAQARALLGLAPDGDDVEVDLTKTSHVQQAQATLDEARGNLERAGALAEERMISQAELETAKASFVRAESGLAAARDEIRTRQASLRQRNFELRLARQQLADAVVRSPLDGVVQTRHAQAGEYLAAGASVATIVRVNPLRMRAEISERDAPLVRVGQAVRVKVDGDDTLHEGRVARLAPALTESSRSLLIEAEVANPGTLRPGSFGRAEIAVDDADEVLAVPSNAIVSFAGIDKVITVEGGKAVENAVVLGRRTEQWTEIVSGIEAGKAVVVDPGNIQQGQPVTITGAP